jgi:hypothetical protein
LILCGNNRARLAPVARRTPGYRAGLPPKRPQLGINPGRGLLL